ncbi:hypothetical protein DFO67_108175 [Modicisalibacter xianhensis]|uniref:Uncharacterized protein n=1 Tax=Modicisalibacter xianhensis TaxID=442341 RepID=A0A4R8FRC9_9GAMM|nr:hypothetical protein [Halomonas xianhensis]TDX29131.1 hypothetical protein DFO67_108175 [Halomonas xianhensis]
MFDQQMAQEALNRMDPAMRTLAEQNAKARGMSACDVVLEAGLLVAQAEAGKALYALQKGGPRLRPV